MNEAKSFCSQISILKLNNECKENNQIADYQAFANQQGEAEKCYVLQLNKYLDTVSGLGSRYNHCKANCLEENPDLQKELQKILENPNKSSEYFNPLSTDNCMQECRS